MGVLTAPVTGKGLKIALEGRFAEEAQDLGEGAFFVQSYIQTFLCC